MIQLRGQYWAYLMPDADVAEIRGEHPGRPYQLLSFYGEADAVELPPGTWEIVCTSKSVTGEQAKEIVEKEELFINGNSQGIYYCNYQCAHDVCEWYKHSINSLQSLLTSKGCDLNKTYLILKNTL